MSPLDHTALAVSIFLADRLSRRLTGCLFAMAFLDELASGILPASTPELSTAFAVSGEIAAVLTLAAPLVLSLVVEPGLFLRADRAADRRPYVRAGLISMAVASIVAAIAPNAWVFAVILALCAPFWGVAVGVAQGALVDDAPADAERRMTRWTLFAALGDVAAPALLAAVAAIGFGWRVAFVVVIAIALATAVWMPSIPRPAVPRDRDEVDVDMDPEDNSAGRPRGIVATLAAAARNRELTAWVIGAFLCTLLDEIFVAFAALHLVERFGEAPHVRAWVLGACLAGSAVGLVVQDRLLARVSGRTLLGWISAICAIAYVAWIFAPNVAVSAILAAIVGLTDAGQWPLAKALAYRAAPGRSGLVNALGAILAPFEVAIPIAIGVIASSFGVTAAMIVLVLQPIGLLLLVLLAPRAS
jgi:MFS family permease